jgi:hypothetical protein
MSGDEYWRFEERLGSPTRQFLRSASMGGTKIKAMIENSTKERSKCLGTLWSTVPILSLVCFPWINLATEAERDGEGGL